MMKHEYAKHGNRHPLYTVWQGMKSRCNNLNNKGYVNYGGRGIGICDEWLNNPVIFIEWALKNGYKKGLLIDRKNNDGNYTPDNCRFVDIATSNRNQRLLNSTNKSGYRGVCWHKRDKKWIAQISVNGKKFILGYFDSPRLAAICYDVEAFLANDGRPRNIIQ